MIIRILVAAFIIEIVSSELSNSGHEYSKNKNNDEHLKMKGGSVVDYKKHPWVGSLQVIKTNKHFCGATLISAWVLLTAIACIHEHPPNKVRVRMSCNDCSKNNWESKIEYFMAEETIKINQKIIPNLAIAVLETKVVYSDDIKWIPMYSENEKIQDSAKVTLPGWGPEKEDGPSLANLKESVLDILDISSCKDYLRIKNDTHSSRYVCTRSSLSFIPAEEDGGGPLVSSDGRLVGILHYAEIHEEDTVAAFIRISAYRKWIDRMVDKVFSDKALDCPGPLMYWIIIIILIILILLFLAYAIYLLMKRRQQRQGQSGRTQRSQRSRQSQRPERSQRSERPERSQRSERPERSQRSERPERSRRSERPERSQRSERPERSQRSERPEEPPAP